MACGYCGSEMVDGTAFCPTCGRAPAPGPSGAPPGSPLAGPWGPTWAPPGGAGGPNGPGGPGGPYAYGPWPAPPNPEQARKDAQRRSRAIAVVVLATMLGVLVSVVAGTQKPDRDDFIFVPNGGANQWPSTTDPLTTDPAVVGTAKPPVQGPASRRQLVSNSTLGPDEQITSWSDPIAIDGTVLVSSDRGHVVATGQSSWQVRVEPLPAGGSVTLVPLPPSSVLAQTRTTTYLVDLASGGIRWRRPVVAEHPAVATTIGLAAFDGPDGVEVFDTDRMSTRWHADLAGFGVGPRGLAFSGDLLLVTNGRQVHGLSAPRGQTRWTAKVDAEVIQPLACPDWVCLLVEDGVTILDPEDGTYLGHAPVAGVDAASVVGVSDDDLVILAPNGSDELVAIDAWTAEPMWSEKTARVRFGRASFNEDQVVVVSSHVDRSVITVVDIDGVVAWTAGVFSEDQLSRFVVTGDTAWAVSRSRRDEPALVGFRMR